MFNGKGSLKLHNDILFVGTITQGLPTLTIKEGIPTGTPPFEFVYPSRAATYSQEAGKEAEVTLLNQTKPKVVLKDGKYQLTIKQIRYYFLAPSGVLYRGNKPDKKGEAHGINYEVFYPNGDRYSGDVREDKREGEGKLTLNSGEVYEGLFKNDELDGFVSYSQDKSSEQKEYFLFEKDLCVRQSTQ